MTQKPYVVGWNGDWSPSQFHPLAQGRITFLLSIEADQISTLDYELGFNHRADEKVLEVRDFRQGLSLINRPNWQNPIAAEMAYAQAAEDLMGLKPPPRALALRQVVLALQNLISASRFAAAIAESTSRSPKAALEFAEALMRWHERITGARLHDAFVRLGGVGADVENSLLLELHEWLVTNPAVELPDLELCTAAAARLEFTRKALNNTAAIAAVAAALETDPPYFVQLPKVVKVPRGQSHQQVDTWIGPIGVWLFSDGGKAPARIHIQPASLTLFTELRQLAVGLSLAEFQELLITSPIGIGEIER